MPVCLQLEGVGGVQHVLLPQRRADELGAHRQPVSSKPQGIDSPGSPARFTGTVSMSLRYIRKGSDRLSQPGPRQERWE